MSRSLRGRFGDAAVADRWRLAHRVRLSVGL